MQYLLSGELYEWEGDRLVKAAKSTAKVGDRKSVNGKTYELNANKRWARVGGNQKTKTAGGSHGDVKAAVFQYFGVASTAELKRSGSYEKATDGMDINLKKPEDWRRIHRKYIGFIPGEENQQGYGTINGVNIFQYFKPWQVFGLDGKTANTEDVKTAYRKLSKIYHPDVPGTGDARIFEKLTQMYKSVTAGVGGTPKVNKRKTQSAPTSDRLQPRQLTATTTPPTPAAAPAQSTPKKRSVQPKPAAVSFDETKQRKAKSSWSNANG